MLWEVWGGWMDEEMDGCVRMEEELRRWSLLSPNPHKSPPSLPPFT